MTRRLLEEYCEAEFENIDAVVRELHALTARGESTYSVPELAAISTFIHNFYNGVENILKRMLIARKLEVINAPTWHKDLLKTAADSGLIGKGLYVSLADYLSFRHFFVHAYSVSLEWENLEPLVENIEPTLKDFKSAVKRCLSRS